MKNKKIKTALIVFIIILTLVLFFNVAVYAAYTLAATDVSYTKPNGTQTSVKAALDEVYAKVPKHQIGDEVTVGGEQFYVLEWDNNCDTVNLISKYNLNKEGTAQQDAAYKTTACAFSSTNYWSNSFTSTPFNLNDFIGYTATDAIGKAKSYGRSKGAVSSRLLSHEEAYALTSKASSNTKIDTMLWGKANSADGFLNYWLGSAGSPYTVWYVRGSYGGGLGHNHFSDGSGDCGGVRPVITVLKSKIS